LAALYGIRLGPMGAALYMAFFFCLHSASVLLSFGPFHSAITLSFPPFLILFCSLFCLLYFDVHRCFHFFVLPFPFLLFWSVLPILLFLSASMPSSFLSFPPFCFCLFLDFLSLFLEFFSPLWLDWSHFFAYIYIYLFIFFRGRRFRPPYCCFFFVRFLGPFHLLHRLSLWLFASSLTFCLLLFFACLDTNDPKRCWSLPLLQAAVGR